jgi:hypothetical protein
LRKAAHHARQTHLLILATADLPFFVAAICAAVPLLRLRCLRLAALTSSGDSGLGESELLADVSAAEEEVSLCSSTEVRRALLPL